MNAVLVDITHKAWVDEVTALGMGLFSTWQIDTNAQAVVLLRYCAPLFAVSATGLETR